MRIALAMVLLAACGDRGGPVFGGTRWDVPAEYWISNLAIDEQGDVIVGGWSSDGPGHNGFIEKLDRDTGESAWTLALPDDSTVVSDIAVGAGGDVAAGGIFSGTIDFGGMTLETADGEFETFVAVYDAAGRLRWVRSLGYLGDQQPRIALALDGTVVVHGAFNGTLGTTTSIDYDAYVVAYDADGNLAWSHVAPAPGQQWGGDFDIAPDGDIVVFGYDQIVRLAPTGAPRWARPWVEGGQQLEIEPGGDILIAGRAEDNAMRIWRLDPTGAEVASFDLWRNDVAGMSFVLAPGGEIVIGTSLGTESIGEDSELYLVALDRDGAIVDSFRGPEWIDNLAIGLDGATVHGNQGRIVLVEAASPD